MSNMIFSVCSTKNFFYSHEIRTHVDPTDVVKTVESCRIIITVNILVSLNENATVFHSRQKMERDEI